MINDLPKKQTPNYFLIIGVLMACFLTGFSLATHLSVLKVQSFTEQYECKKLEVLP